MRLKSPIELIKSPFWKSGLDVRDYAYALDNSSIVSITDQKGIIKNANNNFCNVSKYSREELIGRDHRIINSGYHPKEIMGDLWFTITGGNIWKGELKNKSKDGSAYWVNITIVPVFNKKGIPYQYIAVMVDITRLKYAEEEIRRLNENLELQERHRIEEIEALSATISHDLRIPLRAMSGYARMLQEDYCKILDDEGKRLLAVIQENAKKMWKLFEDLLTFSKSGGRELYKTEINMNQLTKNVFEDLIKLMNSTATLELNTLHPAIADYSLITQVITNLLSNAIKFSYYTESPVIEIRSEKKNDEVIYSVKDNGVGFDMQYVHKLFALFQRLHSVKSFEGTGVGLAIVYRIITKHGGKVWAEGEIGKGATFYFSLPF